MTNINQYKKIIDTLLSLTDKKSFDKKSKEYRSFINLDYINGKMTSEEFEEINNYFKQTIEKFSERLNKQNKENFEKEYSEFIKKNTLDVIPIYNGEYGKTAPERKKDTKIIERKDIKQIDTRKPKGEER